jgi:ribulose 1,5-bisphosphate synthetase/thiazole synthase
MAADDIRKNGVSNGHLSGSLVDQWHSKPRNIRIIHVGAGATGLCAAFKMERQLDNYELVCYEKNNEIGGTWYESKLITLAPKEKKI